MNGGWAQTHGSTLANTTELYLSVDEDQTGDSERNHTTEQIGYIAFGPVTDSDGDGILDVVEIATCTDPDDADTDDDGIIDGDEDSINQDGFVDLGETDPCNADTDGDGIQDGTELGYALSDIGPDTDTNIFIEDADPLTTTDPLDQHSDNDGFTDGQEDKNHNGQIDPGESDPNDETSKPIRAMPWIPLLLLDD